ncbi:MAG: disulfide bond formation protein B [Gammaproteobacteria bacterium]|nr:disulfide bond formation protein B [Gammaproteobacteria bacterium]
MLQKLYGLSKSRLYWFLLMAGGLLLEATALFYQYILKYDPCVLCIHVRIIVMWIIIVSIIALAGRRFRGVLLIFHLLITGLFAFLLERSYMLLGVERGFVTGSCGFDSGLPTWFAVDKWFPFMFKIWEACGYTPVLLFGITMAEALIVMSAGLLILSCLISLAVLKGRTFTR